MSSQPCGLEIRGAAWGTEVSVCWGNVCMLYVLGDAGLGRVPLTSWFPVSGLLKLSEHAVFVSGIWDIQDQQT